MATAYNAGHSSASAASSDEETLDSVSEGISRFRSVQSVSAVQSRYVCCVCASSVLCVGCVLMVVYAFVSVQRPLRQFLLQCPRRSGFPALKVLPHRLQFP